MSGPAAVNESQPLLYQQPTRSQTPYKAIHIVQGVLSLAAFGYFAKESITGQSLPAIVGAAVSLLSLGGAVSGLLNTRQWQNAASVQRHQSVALAEPQEDASQAKAELESIIQVINRIFNSLPSLNQSKQAVAVLQKLEIIGDHLLRQARELDEANVKLGSLRSQLRELEDAKTKLEGELKQKIKPQETSSSGYAPLIEQELQSIRQQKEDLEEEIESLKETIQNHESLAEAQKKQIESLKDLLKQLREADAQSEHSTSLISQTDSVVDDLSSSNSPFSSPIKGGQGGRRDSRRLSGLPSPNLDDHK